jgi:hypothetical protein
MKTAVKPYVKRDGTRVRAHERGGVVEWGIYEPQPGDLLVGVCDSVFGGDGEGPIQGRIPAGTNLNLTDVARDYVKYVLAPDLAAEMPEIVVLTIMIIGPAAWTWVEASYRVNTETMSVQHCSDLGALSGL